MSQPKSLIVGAAGQVGVVLTNLLGDRALPSFRTAPSETSLVLNLAALAKDPGLAQRVLGPLHLDAVYCVGGATDVERCESDVDWAMDTNCYGPAVLAAAARHIPFVYFSTEYVFDGKNGPYTETDPTNAISVYGRSKLEGEQRVLDAHPNALVLRTTVVYGQDQQRKNFLYTLLRLLGSGQTMRVPTDQISSPTYNQDLAHAAVELVCAGQTGIFHVCGPDVISRFDFAILASGILGLDASLLQPVATADLNQRAARPLRAGMLIHKLTSTLPHVRMRPNKEAITEWARLK